MLGHKYKSNSIHTTFLALNIPARLSVLSSKAEPRMINTPAKMEMRCHTSAGIAVVYSSTSKTKKSALSTSHTQLK